MELDWLLEDAIAEDCEPDGSRWRSTDWLSLKCLLTPSASYDQAEKLAQWKVSRKGKGNMGARMPASESIVSLCNSSDILFDGCGVAGHRFASDLT